MKYKLYMKILLLLIAVFCMFGALPSCNKKIKDNGQGESDKQSESLVQSEDLVTEATDLPALTRDEIFQKLKPSIVKVLGYDYDGKTLISQGSGFFIDNNGTFITNAHVVRNCYYIKIQTYFDTVYDVDIMYNYNDVSSDYAICGLKVDYFSIPVEFADSASSGDIVYALGYPKDAFDMNTTSGKILSVDAVDGDKHYYINSAYIDHGSSGGALIDTSGKVLGITTGSTDDGEYVTLKYSNFKDDIKSKYTGGKEPYKYFYNVRDYKFSQSTMDIYFDINVNVISDSDTNIEYAVTVGLNERYRNSKIILNDADVTTITVQLETKYDYYAIGTDTTEHKEHITTDTLYFNFNSLEELKKGVTVNSTSSVSELVTTEYYGMDISYDATFWILQNGVMTLYN